MAEPKNLANAIVLIFSLVMLSKGFNLWILLVALFSLATWEMQTFTEDHKKLLKRQIEKKEMETQKLRAETMLIGMKLPPDY